MVVVECGQKKKKNQNFQDSRPTLMGCYELLRDEN